MSHATAHQPGPTPGAASKDPAAARAEHAKSQLEDVQSTAAATLEEAKATAAVAVEDARHEGERLVKDLASAGKYAARDVQESVVQTAQTLADRKTSEAATHVMHFSAAMHDAADRLREEDKSQVAGYVGSAARTLDQVAEYLDQADLQSILRDAERFAHRRPEVFIGGLAVAGLGIARFLKASKPRRQYEQHAAYDGRGRIEGRTVDGRYAASPQSINRYSGQDRAERYQAAVGRPVYGSNAGAKTFTDAGVDANTIASPAEDVPTAAGVS